MSNKTRIGVIGVGHLGNAHVRILAGHEECELVGCFDIIKEKSENAAKEADTRSFDSADELIASCDAVSLVVPTSEHHACAMQVIEAGKHLFVEKPIASSVEEARQIVESAAAKGLKLMVGHIERFNPAVCALKDKITYPSFIEAHRLAPFNYRGLDVAVIFDLMIHDIDLCLHLTGSEIVDVQASASAVITQTMDIANARLTFASGCVANLTASRISPKGMRKVRIFQPGGYISMDLNEPSAEVYRLLDSDDSEGDTSGFSTSMDFADTGKKITYNRPKIAKYDMLTAELGSFLNSIVSDHPTEVTGEQALTALTVAAEIESIADKGLNNLKSHLT